MARAASRQSSPPKKSDSAARIYGQSMAGLRRGGFAPQIHFSWQAEIETPYFPTDPYLI